MRHINSIYSQRYNRRHKLDGPLFRGRYKSVLVSNDSYLLQLARYIHKNPVKAGMVKEMDKYELSSHRGYLSYAQKWDWLHKDDILSILSSRKQGRLKLYIEFMRQDDSEEVARLFSRKNFPAVFGPQSFISRIKEQFYLKKKNQEVPDSMILAPAPVRRIIVWHWKSFRHIGLQHCKQYHPKSYKAEGNGSRNQKAGD